jgi:hypothetical protein
LVRRLACTSNHRNYELKRHSHLLNILLFFLNNLKHVERRKSRLLNIYFAAPCTLPPGAVAPLTIPHQVRPYVAVFGKGGVGHSGFIAKIPSLVS